MEEKAFVFVGYTASLLVSLLLFLCAFFSFLDNEKNLKLHSSQTTVCKQHAELQSRLIYKKHLSILSKWYIFFL